VKSGHFISVTDLSVEEANSLIKKAAEAKSKSFFPLVLAGKFVSLLFEKPSLRTRVSFEVGITQLGGHCLYLSPEEVGLGKREPVEDVARVLGRYVDCIVARTFAHKTLELLAEYSGVPVVNALSDWEHPCQAMADMLTIYEKKHSLKGLKLAYIGDGNNVANSLLLAAAQQGMVFCAASPLGYEIDNRILKEAEEYALKTGGNITLVSDARLAAENADIVYTDVWTSMGQEAEKEKRKAIFKDFQVNDALMSLAKKDAIFMHPLPAHHVEEVSGDILDKPYSAVFDQAENRLHAQRALLVEMFGRAGAK
jgi:ornithine carbamoyltransferase